MSPTRRTVLAAGLGAAAASALGPAAAAQQAADVAVGDFLLRRAGPGLAVAHREAPDRALWETAADGRFLAAERATAEVGTFGAPHGSYQIRDRVAARFDVAEIDAVAMEDGRTVVRGRLDPGPATFAMTFEALSKNQLRFEITAATSGAPAANRIRLRLASAPGEAFFGFGVQLTQFNQKGHELPILVQEHGIGRGRRGLTRAMDILAAGAGGNPYITEAPAAHFVSSRLRSLSLENTEYSTFDLRPADYLEIKVWSGTMTGRILYGAMPLDLIEAHTEFAGRMRPLPAWVQHGAIVAAQGGTSAVRARLAAVRAGGVPLAALWVQDWCGARVTDAGRQLWWDWRLDTGQYPGWSELVAEVAADGARMLVYINPFLDNTDGHDALFREAGAKGYLVRHPDGAAYLIRNTDFSAGLVDLTNPEARDWIKAIIRDEVMGRAGASGWMADFGEALPFDGLLHGGADPATWHNRYPEEWARVNREAIEEAGRGEDVVFFSRSGFTASPGAATLFWLGDQLQSWDAFDGIKTAVVGMLSSGISGFSLQHSDTGGYVSLAVTVDGHMLKLLARSDELLQRWIELNAFTAVLRTHDGLDPGAAAQVDSNPANMAHLARFAGVYAGLAAYRTALMEDAATRGHPLVRHPFLHYPDDANTHALRYQFLLGPDLMVAPVLDPGRDAVEVYFPGDGDWLDLWTGRPAETTGWARMPAALSRPAVFLRGDGAHRAVILDGLRAAGVLEW